MISSKHIYSRSNSHGQTSCTKWLLRSNRKLHSKPLKFLHLSRRTTSCAVRLSSEDGEQHWNEARRRPFPARNYHRFSNKVLFVPKDEPGNTGRWILPTKRIVFIIKPFWMHSSQLERTWLRQIRRFITPTSATDRCAKRPNSCFENSIGTSKIEATAFCLSSAFQRPTIFRRTGRTTRKAMPCAELWLAAQKNFRVELYAQNFSYVFKMFFPKVQTWKGHRGHWRAEGKVNLTASTRGKNVSLHLKTWQDNGGIYFFVFFWIKVIKVKITKIIPNLKCI